jgi:hypothetical protein
MKPLRLLSLILGVMLSMPASPAMPLRFSTTQQSQQQQFNYQFDFNGQPQQLQFAISNATLAGHFRQFRSFQPALLQQYLWQDLRSHAAQYPNVRLKRLPQHSGLRYQIRTNDAELQQKLSTELKQLTAQRTDFYLQRDYYYRHTMLFGEQYIIPDHQRLMADSLTDLLPLAQALHAKLANTPSRDSLAYISSWLQQIPYQDLSDRSEAAGTSFSPPLKMLQENRGDCDSKAVLLAALLRMLLPDVRLAMIYLPQHAMLAVQLPAKAEDMTVTIDGRVYLLVDPTGPAQLPPGTISLQHQLYSRNNQFSYRLL